MPPLATIGPYQLYALETGRFGLDGGAMFGVVPKPLWEKKTTPDAKNRIPLAARALLLVAQDRKILVDVGLGDKWQEKAREMYAIDQRQNTLVTSLRSAGFAPEEITDVLLTHLHFDHAGGSTRREGERIIPTFSRALYHVQERNWKHANQPTLRDQASYLKEDFEALKQFDQLKFYRTPDGFDHDEELLPGIQALVCNGHTPGLQMIKVSDGRATCVSCADTIPTSAHLPLPWVMGYDLQPLVTLEEKKKLLEGCRESDWQLFFEHDPHIALTTVSFDDHGRPTIR
jgi:glyoxylase-like metal-dependent hydrolase (beta-lactamase superfamily II)